MVHLCSIICSLARPWSPPFDVPCGAVQHCVMTALSGALSSSHRRLSLHSLKHFYQYQVQSVYYFNNRLQIIWFWKRLAFRRCVSCVYIISQLYFLILKDVFKKIGMPDGRRRFLLPVGEVWPNSCLIKGSYLEQNFVQVD